MEELQPAVRTSVLIVTRNQSAALRRTIESLAAEAATEATEVIVVDNASTDGSQSLDAEFPQVKMLRMQRNFGWTKGVNVGTRTAKGEFLCLTPPGIEFEPDTLSRLITCLREDPDVRGVCPLSVDAQGVPATRVYPLPDAKVFWQFWKTGRLGPPLPLDLTVEKVRAHYVTGTPLLIRRQSIAGMNYLDERYGQFWADAEICYQIARAGKAIVVLPGVRVRGPQPFQAIPEKLDSWGAKLSADAALGGAAYLMRHEGFLAGLRFRVAATLAALVATLDLRRAGPHFVRFLNVLTGQKIDGNQGA
jgi:GT2 family glycosyltransferase